MQNHRRIVLLLALPTAVGGALEKKGYARGLGIVPAESSSGEVWTLVSVTKE